MNNEIYYCHIRIFNPWNYYAGRDQPRINNLGGATIAMQETLAPDMSKAIVVAISRCSDKDNFNKATGRNLAAKRLNIFGESYRIIHPEGLRTVHGRKMALETAKDFFYKMYPYELWPPACTE